MNTQLKKAVCLSALILLTIAAVRFSETETFHKKGKTLILFNQDPDFSPEVKEALVETFFKVYPRLVKDFNPKAADTIRVQIDTSYSGVAYADGGRIVISSASLHSHPGDTDLFTHELMHVVQNYPHRSAPSWLTEGIADYVRYEYGLDNKAAGWSLTEFSAQHHYTNSYRITARFLLWLTQQYEKDLVKRIDERIRNNNYSDDLWKLYTGKLLDELWSDYSQNPELMPKEISQASDESS